MKYEIIYSFVGKKGNLTSFAIVQYGQYVFEKIIARSLAIVSFTNLAIGPDMSTGTRCLLKNEPIL